MQDIYKQIVAVQHKCRDYLDQPQAAAAQQLTKEIQRLEDEAQSNRNPRSLEDRIKGIIRLLDGLDDETVMDPHHVDDLRDRLEDIRNDVRKL